MDIQPVLNHYKALIYVCTYLTKAEEECSHAMAQAKKEAWDKSLNNYEQMKLIIKAYATKRVQCSSSLPYYARAVAEKNIFCISICKDKFTGESF